MNNTPVLHLSISPLTMSDTYGTMVQALAASCILLHGNHARNLNHICQCVASISMVSASLWQNLEEVNPTTLKTFIVFAKREMRSIIWSKMLTESPQILLHLLPKSNAICCPNFTSNLTDTRILWVVPAPQDWFVSKEWDEWSHRLWQKFQGRRWWLQSRRGGCAGEYHLAQFVSSGKCNQAFGITLEGKQICFPDGSPLYSPYHWSGNVEGRLNCSSSPARYQDASDNNADSGSTAWLWLEQNCFPSRWRTNSSISHSQLEWLWKTPRSSQVSWSL